MYIPRILANLIYAENIMVINYNQHPVSVIGTYDIEALSSASMVLLHCMVLLRVINRL